MKTLLINGSPHDKGCTFTALSEIIKILNASGVETEMLNIGTKPVAGCIACGSCSKTGRCIYDDLVNDIASRIDSIDAIVVGSPVYYAGPSAQVCALLDRLFYCCGSKMAGKLAASVMSCRRGGASATFDRLNKYFAMTNMIIVGSQYWNQVHGKKADDVLKDGEGLQTMRTLAQNMVWLLQSIEAGRASGVLRPVYESKIWTNFIRD